MSEVASEISLEAIVHFNEDMKIISMNAFQMEKLLGLCMQENKVILQMIENLDAQSHSIQSDLLRNTRNVHYEPNIYDN